MNYHKKSKEELIEEINQLRTSYEALKEYYEKDTLLLKEAEKQIYKSEEKFRKAFITSPDSININRMSDGLYVSVNEGFKKLIGYNEEESIGKTSIELGIWADPSNREKLLKELKEKGKVENFEALFRTKDGRLLYGLMSASIIDLDGVPHILNITRDITNLKKTELELEKERNLLRTLIDVVPDRIYAKDIESRFIICNKALVKRMGKDDESEIIGKSDFDLLPKNLAEQFYSNEQEVITTGNPLINKEETMGTVAGLKRWNLASKVPLKDAEGRITGIVGVGRDITELKRSQIESQALSEITSGISTTSNLDELLKLIHCSLANVVYAENCFIALYNEKTDLFSFPYFIDKYDTKPLPLSMGKSCTSYVYRTGKPWLFTEESFNKLLENNEVGQVGTPSPSWIGIPLQTPSKILGVLVLQHYEEANAYTENDLKFLVAAGSQIAQAIDRKMNEEEIKLKNELLQTINAEKDKFFSIIAHDLRGPLSAFVEATKILTEDIKSMSLDQVKEIINVMKNDASNIYTLLENLLEWSRLQRGVMEFKPEKLFLLESVNSSIEAVKVAARKKSISIDSRIDPGMVISGDRHMFETILRNLVSNAVKFTPAGGKIIISSAAAETGSVEITVKDNGIGIPGDLMAKLFSLTEKSSRPGTEGEPSSGLGLHLCKEFIEKHGGRIFVKSEPGNGSSFSFPMPLAY